MPVPGCARCQIYRARDARCWERYATLHSWRDRLCTDRKAGEQVRNVTNSNARSAVPDHVLVPVTTLVSSHCYRPTSRLPLGGSYKNSHQSFRFCVFMSSAVPIHECLYYTGSHTTPNPGLFAVATVTKTTATEGPSVLYLSPAAISIFTGSSSDYTRMHSQSGSTP